MDESDSTAELAVRPPTSSLPSSKRLIFDRRYGWVFDEWKEPSKEALAGGRGMFCILPIAKGMLNIASDTINLAASSTVKVLENPEVLSPDILLTGLNDHLQKFTSSLHKPEFKLPGSRNHFTPALHSPSSSSEGIITVDR